MNPFGFFPFAAFLASAAATSFSDIILSNRPLSGFLINSVARAAPRRPKLPITQYDALHPIFFIKIIVIDERAIPIKLAPDRIEFAVLLLSYGK